MAFQKHDFVNGHILTANEMNEIEDGIKNLENATPSSAVSSVNGQTGDVKLNAEDVGALPKITKIPSNTNDLNNNSGFITNAANDLINYYLKSETYTREEINLLIAQVPKFAISVVSTLPTANISTTTIYLVGGGETGDLYTEYIYVDGAWELLGRQRVDLTGYATETWVVGQLAGYQPKGDYALKSELPTVPTKVSEFQNDAGYLTEHQDISGKLDADKLPEAVNDALAQAKNSGEFDGEDGISPSASVEQTEEGAVITISDVEGTTTAVVKNGQDGYTPQKGKDYVDGKDGVSLRHWWSGSVLYIESDPPSGENSHGVDLEGPQGERGRSIYTTQRAPTISADGSAYYNLSKAGLPYYDTKVGDLILCAENGDIYIVDELLTPAYNVVVNSVCNTKGVKGDDGVGIASVGVNRTPDENGFCYIIVNLTDGQQQAIPYRDGKDGTDATVTSTSIKNALGYTPADSETVSQLSADMANKLDANNLSSAVNDALAQAKASGEFDGKDGKTPVKGVDYNTPADQEEIVQQVIAALGTPVFGRVDVENNIILTGELAEGTYTIKYEDTEGNVVDIGTLDNAGVPEPAYTNLANSSDSNWIIGKRYNSSKVLTDFSGGVITNYFDVSGCKEAIHVKGIKLKEDGNSRIYVYSSEANAPLSYANTQSTSAITVSNYDPAVYIIPASHVNTYSNKLWRLGGLLTGTSADVIITIDEKIV